MLGTDQCFGGHSALLLALGQRFLGAVAALAGSCGAWGWGCVQVTGVPVPPAGQACNGTGCTFFRLERELASFFFAFRCERAFLPIWLNLSYFSVFIVSLVVVCSRMWPLSTCESHWELLHPSSAVLWALP